MISNAISKNSSCVHFGYLMDHPMVTLHLLAAHVLNFFFYTLLHASMLEDSCLHC